MQITTPNGHTFQLYDNDIVTIDLFSSLFTTDGELKGSYSYSGKAPLLPNKHIIQYADLLEAKSSGTIEKVQVRLGNIYWTDVILKFKIIDGKEIEWNITLNLSLINSRIKNTKLSQIPFPYFDLGGTVSEVETNMKLASQGDFKKFPFVFAPISNIEFEGEIDDGVPEGITAPPVEFDRAVNTIRVENGVIEFNAPNRSYTVEGQDLPAFKHHAVPFFSLTYVLEYIITWLGFVPDGNALYSDEIKKLVIYNINDSYMSTRGLSWIPTGQQTNMFVSAANHLPEISISDFFKIILNYPGIFPILRASTNTLSFEFKSNIDRFPVLDWRDKQTNVDEVDPINYGGYHIYMEASDSIDEWTEGEEQDEIKTGAAENKIELPVTMLAEEDLALGSYRFNVPMDNQEGNVFDPNFRRLSTFTSPKDKRDFKLTFLYYNGYVNNGSGIQYPYLSTVNTATGQTLKVAGEKGIYHKYLAPFMLRVEGAKNVKVDLLLNNLDLVLWQDHSIVLFRSKTGVTIPGLIKKLSCDVKNGATVISARAEAVLLDTATYKELPIDMPFLRFTLINERFQRISAVEWKRLVDIKFELFRDRECTLPYTPGTPIVFDMAIIVRQSDYSAQSRGASTISSEAQRIALTTQEFIMPDFITAHFRRSTPAYFFQRKARVYDTSYFYVLAD
uniref:Uncharacterized protein n=1 Tax=Sphingobacterium sp. (strain 21) TaxID=743722 RepID=F4C2B9_SPHS2